MKLTRKLIPAFVMLLVSAVLMSTASFAWFAMNETVSATGMKVTADAEFIFLEIKGTKDDTFKTTGTSDLDATLFPVAHESFASITDMTDIEKESNWYYQFSNNPASAAAATEDKTTVGSGKFGNFVAKTTYTIKLHAGMVETAYDVHVSSIEIPANKGITVIVAGANGYQELNATDTEISYAEAGKVLFNTVGLDEATVNVYIYFNGADENVKTDNIANLIGEVNFKLTAYTADHT